MRTLNNLAEAGLIKLHKHTGVKFGNGGIAYYIDDRTEGTPFTFKHKRTTYELKYISGCFYPFVYKVKRY